MEGLVLSRLALYRKYRPADFSEAVGQEHITATLESAISQGKAAHAYLFTGPRGTGKTTVARIVAKRLNDLGPKDDIANELDIVEIDGASNRGIDEIRSLREKVRVAPSKLKYKVYIIDEVHMLTREAFNALLKTLEEPPSHVVFVFATTEVQKLPETIISRTQRFDFRPIATEPLQKRLGEIAKKEDIKINDDAIALIAALSRGGFRDAISLLDQLSVNQSAISSELVRKFTGLQDPTLLKGIIVSVSQNKTQDILKQLQELYNDGADPVIITGQLLDMVQAELAEPTMKVDVSALLDVAHRLHTAQVGFKHSSLPQLALQVALAKSQTQVSISTAPSSVEKPAAQPNTDPVKVEATDKLVTKPTQTNISSDQEAMLIKALSIIKRHNNSLYAVMRGSQLSIEGKQINIACRFSFHRDRMNEGRNRELIEKAFSKVYDQSMQVKIEVEQETAKQPAVDADSELVSSAMAILGGELVEG